MNIRIGVDVGGTFTVCNLGEVRSGRTTFEIMQLEQALRASWDT